MCSVFYTSRTIYGAFLLAAQVGYWGSHANWLVTLCISNIFIYSYIRVQIWNPATTPCRSNIMMEVLVSLLCNVILSLDSGLNGISSFSTLVPYHLYLKVESINRSSSVLKTAQFSLRITSSSYPVLVTATASTTSSRIKPRSYINPPTLQV